MTPRSPSSWRGSIPARGSATSASSVEALPGTSSTATTSLLGTPPETRLLAYSEGHSDNYPHVGEEIFFNFPHMGGTMDFQVRADITYFTTKNGGAVFSTSSISWCGSLAHNGYDNNVSRMTGNVLRRFMQDEPL